MQIANALVSIAGDRGNTVPKYGLTAAEIAVLRLIHGEDAVTDVEPAGAITRSNKAELDRLRTVYGGATDNDGNRLVDQLFPGAGARVFASLAELDLPSEFMKPTGRAQIEPVDEADEEAEPVEMNGAAPAPVEPADEIADMKDQLFN